MNNNVSVEGTEAIANELKEITSILKDDYDSISMAITKINENINTLKSWNGSDAITEPYPSKMELSRKLELLGIELDRFELYKIETCKKSLFSLT